MASCTGVGVYSKIFNGSCKKKKNLAMLKMNAGISALQSAQFQADKNCPDGRRCRAGINSITIVTAPTARTSTVKYKTKRGRKMSYKICHVFASVLLNGTCEPEAETPSEPEEVNEIRAKDYRDFFWQVDDLPELPLRPTGPCRLYKRQHKRGYSYPICAGECPDGKKCKTSVKAKKNGSVVAKCKCK